MSAESSNRSPLSSMSTAALSLKVLESLFEGCQIIDSNFRYVFVNESAAAHGRTTISELRGRTMMECYPGIDQTEMFLTLCMCMADGKPRMMENHFVYPDGSSAWFELRFQSIPGATAVFSLDITERKRAEAALLRTARALRVLSESNQTLARATDEASYIADVCRIVVDHGGYSTGWLGLVNAGGALEVQAHAGPELDWDAAVSGATECGGQAAPAITAIETRQPCILHLSTDEAAAEAPVWLAEMHTKNTRSCAALPVHIEDRIAGAFVIHAVESEAFDDDEVRLLAELALDLGFGIQTLRGLSERRRAEARYRDLVENLEDIVISTDSTGTLTYVSPAIERSFGYGVGSLLGEPVSELVHPDDIPTLNERFASTLRGEAASVELRVFDSRGAIREVSVRMRIRAEDGDVLGVDGVVTDETKLRRAEQAERELLRAHSVLLGNLPGMAYRSSVDRGWRLELVSEGCLELTGYTREELLGRAWAELVHEEDLARIEAEVDAAASAGAAFVIQYRIHTKDGGVRWVWEKGVPTAGRNGVKLFEGLVTDVTSRIRAEEQAREGRARIRAIFDHLPNACYVWRRRGQRFILSDYSDVAAVISDGAVSELLGRPPADLPVEIPGLEEELAACLASGTSGRREVDCILPAGTETRRYVLSFGFVPTDSVVMYAEDVTAEHQHAEQIRVSQRLESIGRLAGGVAHDFNNLLSVILSYSDFALEGLSPEDQVREDIEEVKKAGQRAAALTRQLLAFSRKQVMEPQVLDLNAVYLGIEAMLRRLLGEDIEICSSLAADLARVEADPGQIEQVIMNLAVNARDAMPNGGSLIIETANVSLDEDYASVHISAGAGDYVMLAMTDTGMGMNAETLERIFEPFFTTKGQGKGTGLGLSMVYGIVKQSGGNIWAYSEVGHGTCFKVYLPAIDAPADPARRGTGPGIAVGSETVMVVEDEDAVRRLAERVLRAAGYTVLGASRPTDALRLCRQHTGTIHLLLTDVIMPHISGRELAEQLVALRPEMRVIYTSGYTDDAIVRHGVLDPGTRFISKPFSAAALTNKVRDALDSKAQGEE